MLPLYTVGGSIRRACWVMGPAPAPVAGEPNEDLRHQEGPNKAYVRCDRFVHAFTCLHMVCLRST